MNQDVSAVFVCFIPQSAGTLKRALVNYLEELNSRIYKTLPVRKTHARWNTREYHTS